VYDLPHDLRSQHSHATQPLGNSATVLNQPKSEHPYGSPAPRVASETPAQQNYSPEDWTFLRDFGDPRDDFYELDEQLRGLLDGGLDPQQMTFIVET
jgi:hypothetical protein